MKCALKLLVALALGLLLVIGVGIAMIDPLISTAVTEGVTYTTQQETELESLNLGLLSGEFSFEGLTLANPPGFQDTPMLRVGSFRTKLDTTTVGGERIDLDLIELDGLELALELKGTDSNVGALLKRLKELQEQAGAAMDGGGQDDAGAPDESAENEGPQLRIQRISVAGVKASLRISDVPLADGVYELSVPDFVLDNFSDETRDASAAQWTAYLLESVLNQALVAGQDVFPGEWQGLLQSQLASSGLLQGDLEGAKSMASEALEAEGDKLMEQAKDDPKGALKTLEEDAKNLGDLFGGKN